MELGEPEVAVRPGGDLQGLSSCEELGLGDDARRGDPADRALIRDGEPEVAVRPGGDPADLTAFKEARGDLGDDARRRDAADLAGVLAEPEVAVGTGGGHGGGGAGACAPRGTRA